MVLRCKIKTCAGILLFLTLAIIFSCEELQPYFANCSECTADEPVRANLEIKAKYQGDEILINIYEGNLEDSIFYDSFIMESSRLSHNVPINKTYTITARYFYNGNYYVVVNSVTPRVKYIENQCEEPCYFIYDKVVDLRLKYTK